MASAKTEKPTQERLRKARQQGQFLSARGMLGAIQFIAALVLLGRLIPGWKSRMQISMSLLLQRGINGDIGSAEWPVIIRTSVVDTLMPIVGMGVILLVLSVAVHFGMTKMGFSLQRLMPKFDRFNPMSRLKGLPAQNLNS